MLLTSETFLFLSSVSFPVNVCKSVEESWSSSPATGTLAEPGAQRQFHDLRRARRGLGVEVGLLLFWPSGEGLGVVRDEFSFVTG